MVSYSILTVRPAINVMGWEIITDIPRWRVRNGSAATRTKLIDIVLNGLQGPVAVKGKTYNGLMPAHGAFLDDNAVASIVSYIRKNKRFGNAAGEVTPIEVAELRKTAKKK